ncbi:MAG: MBL fold metallo-hydrolase [Fimbriimonadales bacterium]
MTWLGVAGLSVGILTGLFQPRPTRLAVLSVGQGDCVVFQHSGTTILVDAAPAKDDWDAGERLAVPELRTLGVDRVDLVLLTHPDSDHIGGLAGIARAYPIGAVGLPRRFAHRSEVAEAMRRADCGRLIPLGDGDRIEVGGFLLDVAMNETLTEDNAGSLMIRIRGGPCGAVLTGDAPVEAEALAERRFRGGAVQVLKAGHHGSKSSTGEGLLRALRPTWLVVSVGRNNPYGHPSSEVLRRAEAAGARVWRTDRHGTAVFEASPSGFRWVGD